MADEELAGLVRRPAQAVLDDAHLEGDIIGYAYHYEQATLRRMAPRLRAARRVRECPDVPGGFCAK